MIASGRRSRANRSFAAGGLVLALVLLTGARQAIAQPANLPGVADASAPPAGLAALDIAFEKYELANGLEIILHRDSTLPLVAVNIWYHVGPVNEPRGRSGFAHLFEHLMFEGSLHVGQRFDTLMESIGATNVNGTTSWDRTNYFATVPREHLALALWIESDRMAYLLDTLTPGELEKQKGIVLNERRQTYENEPYGPSTLKLFDTLFPPGHPYNGLVIGSAADIAAATMDDVRDFYRRYYVPNNATLTIAGDIVPDEAKALIEKYFGTIPAGPRSTRDRAVTPGPSQAKEVVVAESVELARVSMAWIVPPAYGPDDAALEVLSAVLAGGRATELYRELVVRQKIAADVTAYLDGNALCGMFMIEATAATGVAPQELERAALGVIERLGTLGPSPADVQRAKRRILVGLHEDFQLLNGGGGESGRAGILQRFNHYLGEPGFLPRYVTSLQAVSAEELKRVASTHLAANRRAAALTIPKASTGRQAP